MSNCTMKKVKNEYVITENKTGNVIYKAKDKTHAHKKLAFFNMGGSFDGWTPSFFLREMPEISYSEVE